MTIEESQLNRLSHRCGYYIGASHGRTILIGMPVGFCRASDRSLIEGVKTIVGYSQYAIQTFIIAVLDFMAT